MKANEWTGEVYEIMSRIRIEIVRLEEYWLACNIEAKHDRGTFRALTNVLEVLRGSNYYLHGVLDPKASDISTKALEEEFPGAFFDG
jgi:hypothetical protein